MARDSLLSALDTISPHPPTVDVVLPPSPRGRRTGRTRGRTSLPRTPNKRRVTPLTSSEGRELRPRSSAREIEGNAITRKRKGRISFRRLERDSTFYFAPYFKLDPTLDSLERFSNAPTTSGRCSLDKVANHPIRYVPNDETRVSQSLQPELYKEGGGRIYFSPWSPPRSTNSQTISLTFNRCYYSTLVTHLTFIIRSPPCPVHRTEDARAFASIIACTVIKRDPRKKRQGTHRSLINNTERLLTLPPRRRFGGVQRKAMTRG